MGGSAGRLRRWAASLRLPKVEHLNSPVELQLPTEPGRVTAMWGIGVDETKRDLDADDVDRLLEQLDSVPDTTPFLVDLTDVLGRVLSVGIGRSLTVLSFIDESSTTEPYLTSWVEPPIAEDSLWFDYYGSESEFAPEQVVDVGVARAVVRSFVTTGDRSGVDWRAA